MNLTAPELPQEEDFAALWESYDAAYDYVVPKRGDIRQGLILTIDRDNIIVDIGAKQDAMIAPREVSRMTREERTRFVVGKTINVFVLRYDDDAGALLVSVHMAAEYEDWLEAEQLMESGDMVKVEITGYNKGGLLCQFKSLQGFVPASQVATLRPRQRGASEDDALAVYVGEELATKVIEVNRRRRRLILSERAAAREWRAQQRDSLLEDLEQGQVRTGIVSNLCDFGAFVDLGGMDGLVHLSELSWGRVQHPSEVLHVGDEIQVAVLNIDRDRQRVGLSIRRLQPDPWSVVESRYTVGQLVTGKVTHLVKFGAFVELEPGIEGLVHVSELPEGDQGGPGGVVSEGKELTLLILGVDAEQHRISLSLKQADDVTSEEEAGSVGDETQDAIGPDIEPSDELAIDVDGADE